MSNLQLAQSAVPSNGSPFNNATKPGNPVALAIYDLPTAPNVSELFPLNVRFSLGHYFTAPLHL